MAAAILPCSDSVNHPGIACHAHRRDCVDPAHAGAAFSVCDNCATATAIGGLPAVITQQRLRLDRPHLLNPDGTIRQPRIFGLRTLVCNACAMREIELCQARDLGVAPPEYDIRWRDRRFMERYPVNTCTCRGKAFRQDRPRRQSHRQCLPHRTALCNALLARRNMNRTWLEHTAKDAAWNTIGSRVSTRNRRNREATFRACRCGNTVEARFGSIWPPAAVGPNLPAGLPDVYQCLACEGIIHQRGVLNARDFNPRRHNRDFQLGRARGPGTA